MKKSFKVLIALLLVVSVGFGGMVCASAYRPLVDIKSSDWVVGTNGTYSAVYPESPQDWLGNDSVFNYNDLNGSTCFYSTHWTDDFTISESQNVVFPAFPSTVNNNCQTALLRSGDLFYLFVMQDPSFFKLLLDSQGYPGYYADIETMLYVYVFSPTSTDWTLLFSDLFFDLYEVLSFNASYIPYTDPYTVVWSDCNIYRYTSKDGIGNIVHSPDNFVLQNKTFSFTFSKQMSVLGGGVKFDLTAYQMQRFVSGAYCVRIDDMGIIAGTETTIAQLWYTFSVVSGGQLLGVYRFTDNAFEDFGISADHSLSPGSRVFKDLLCISDIDIDVDDSAAYSVQFQALFLSDGYNLFFPGSLEIIEFESYEDDMQHEEIKDAIQSAADVVSGSVASAKTELSQEIVQAATDIKTAVNDSAADIVQSVDSAADVIGGKLDDVKDSVDNASQSIRDKLHDVGETISNKLESVKNSILDGIKSFFIPSEDTMAEIKEEWSELFKSRLGALYEVSDIITDFAESLKYAGEKNTIEMPAVTVNFGDTPFTFGGYEVQVVPDGFDILTTTLKIITSIVCTLLFINALRHKYDKLVGGDD